MKKIRVYLDNCCFNRPYDDQTQIKIEVETRAKLHIQSLVLDKKIELAWSYMLDYENSKNSHEKTKQIGKWKKLSVIDVDETKEIIDTAISLTEIGLRPADALHIACAIAGGCDYFLTVDRGILNKNVNAIKIIDTTAFLREWEDYHVK